MAEITVAAPTWLEYVAARLTLRGHRVIRTGVGKYDKLAEIKGRVVICGLVGALDPSLAPGTVVVAERAGAETGKSFPCDTSLVEAMIRGARGLGYDVRRVHMLSADHIVTGDERTEWFKEGFDAVDMELAHWLKQGVTGTSVRVVLDTASRPISADWQEGTTALWRPRVWPELGRLAAYAPRYALRAGGVVRAGIEQLGPA